MPLTSRWRLYPKHFVAAVSDHDEEQLVNLLIEEMMVPAWKKALTVVAGRLYRLYNSHTARGDAGFMLG